MVSRTCGELIRAELAAKRLGLFLFQCGSGIDARGAPSGQPAGNDGNCE
jgi:hypothetical protein